MTKKFSGSGGLFGGGQPTDTDDNLFSTDIVEVVLGVSEGSIKGLKDGPKSFLLGDTPLQDVAGNNNFDSFELVIRKGSPLGERIVSRMGGFASSTTVSTELATNVPVVRSGTHTDIDYIDIRLVINRLLRQNDSGTFNHTGKVKIEYKKTSSPTWLPVSTISNNPPVQEVNTTNTDIFTELQGTDRVSASPGDRPVYRQAAQPVAIVGQSGALWLDSDDNDKPYTLNGATWGAIPGASWDGTRWLWTETSSWGSDRQTALYRTVSDFPAIYEQGDFWIQSSTNRVLFYNGSSWIFAGTSLAPGGFGSTGVTLNDGEISITGKTTTSFVKEFRFPIDKIADDTYQLRVTKTSPNNTSEDFFDISWESFQEVTATPMQFPGLATAQITARASEQFSSIPQFSGIYQGRIVKVPVNYDPVLKTYAGVWDGTWKLAFTDNPAYIVNDLVENDVYGLNAYYPVVLNKWDVYDAGQWCDERTVDGIPRFTFNQLIDTPRNCREAIEYICGLFGGRFFDDGNGFANIRIDKPSNSAGIFAKENVVDGIFSYSFTDATTRYNDITVTFKNPDLNYKEDRRRVFNQDHIDKYGRIPLNFIAVGCNSSAEAIIRGRYKLVTGLGETTIVNFKTNRQGLYYVPYDIILIVDEDMNSGISGRMKEITGAKTFSLRDPVYLEPGFNYKVMFQVPDGTDVNNFLVLEREIAPGSSGSFNTITTVTDLPAGIPENAVFIISTVTAEQDPRPYRITRIDEVDGDPDNVEIQAIEVNRLKWAFVDGEITDYEEPEVYDLETGTRTLPVPALRIRAFNTLSGPRRVHNVLLDWDASLTRTTTHYKVYMSKDNGPSSLLAQVRILSFEWNDIQPGEYLFTVVACSSVASGLAESVPTTIEHRFVGDIPDPERVIDLRLVDEAAPPIYARRSPGFDWTAVTNPNHSLYVVRIYDSVSGVVLAQHTARDSSFVYDYQTNRADHAGVPVRDFDIGVASRDQFNVTSAFNIIQARNPPPAVTAPIIVPGVSSAVISWVTTGITDYLGAKVWISETPGFTPDGSNLKYNGGGNNFTFVGFPGTVYYLKIALFDDFNQTDFNISGDTIFSVNGVDIEDLDGVFGDSIGYISDDGGQGLAARLAALQEQLDTGSLRATQQGIADWENRGTIRRQVKVQGAAFTEQIDVLSNADEALASQIVALTASVGDNAAAVVAESVARVGADGALATSITEVAANFDTYSASGRAGFQVSATPVGATARYAIVVRAGTVGSMLESGFYLDIFPGGTRAAIKADSFYLLSAAGGYLTAPFYVSAGVTYINNALIQNLTAANIAAGAINSSHIQAGAIVAGKLDVGVINASSLFVNGVVVTGSVANNAITVSAGYADMSIMYFGGGGEVTVATTSLVSTAGINYVDFSCKSFAAGNWAPNHIFRIYENGALVYTVPWIIDDGTGERNVVIQLRQIASSIPYTYTVTIQNTGSGGQSCGHEARFLRVLNLKR